jgi:multidrug resistance efflux pump
MIALRQRLRQMIGTARFWVISIAVLIVLLVIYYGLAARYTPYTTDAYIQAYVIQVAPQVSGEVVRVAVKENELVQRGALLFEIDPRPYEHKARQLAASHETARQAIAQMESDLRAARAEEMRIAADEEYAQAVFDQETLIFKKDATTERKYLDAMQKQKATKALREKARAVIAQKEQALEAKLGPEHAIVAETGAQLATAQLNLGWTKVYAPVTGYVTNLQLQPGSYVQPGRPVLTCIDAESWWIVANFRETNLEGMQPGQSAGLAFKANPGHILPGKVVSIGYGVAQGQGVPSGELPAIADQQHWIPIGQRFQVRLVLDDPSAIPLRVGATASVLVYTTEHSPLNWIADAWQRLASWAYYLR